MSTPDDSPAYRAEYSVPLLKKILVADAMVPNPVTVSPKTYLSDLADLMKSKGINAAPVLDSERLIGIITTRDMARVSEDEWSRTLVVEVMSKRLIIGYSNETLYEALRRMTKNGLGHLPTVDNNYCDKLIGFLAVYDIASAYDMQNEILPDNKE